MDVTTTELKKMISERSLPPSKLDSGSESESDNGNYMDKFSLDY